MISAHINTLEVYMEKLGIAHANFRRGLNDYHDGENVTDQLGNDEFFFQDRYFQATAFEFNGKEAAGNDLLENEENDEQEYLIIYEASIRA
jgi:hypothetical protein